MGNCRVKHPISSQWQAAWLSDWRATVMWVRWRISARQKQTTTQKKRCHSSVICFLGVLATFLLTATFPEESECRRRVTWRAFTCLGSSESNQDKRSAISPHGGARRQKLFPSQVYLYQDRGVSGSTGGPLPYFSPPPASPCCRVKSVALVSVRIAKYFCCCVCVCDSCQNKGMSSVSYHISNLLEKMTSTDKDFR